MNFFRNLFFIDIESYLLFCAPLTSFFNLPKTFKGVRRGRHQVIRTCIGCQNQPVYNILHVKLHETSEVRKESIEEKIQTCLARFADLFRFYKLFDFRQGVLFKRHARFSLGCFGVSHKYHYRLDFFFMYLKSCEHIFGGSPLKRAC